MGWQGSERLAEACEAAGLTVIQAEAARLAAAKYSYRAIADALDVPYKAARGATNRAALRLRVTQPRLVVVHRRLQRELIGYLANVRPHNPRAHVYRERSYGWDRTPIRLRSRLTGQAADDLTNEPLRFLKDLPTILEEIAQSDP